MKKTWKKVIVMMLALSLIGGMMTGCNSKKDTTPTTDSSASKDESTKEDTAEDTAYAEPMEISIASWGIDSSFLDTDNDAMYQFLSKKFNFTVKPVNTTWDDYTQKIQTWAAAGTMPDIVSTDAIGTQSYRNWTTQGVVRPLLDLDAAKYPNLAEYFETEDIKALADAKGDFYCVPRRMYPTLDWSALDRVVAYRWDIAQEAGITKEPETWDEFNAMLKAVVSKDPRNQNITGLSTTSTKLIGGFFWLYSNPIATGDGSGSDYKWIKEDGKFIPAVFSKNALASLKNMRTMYDDGLIDPDIALTNLNTACDKLVAGNSEALLLAGGFNNMDIYLYSQRWAKLYPDLEMTDCIKVLKPFKGTNGEYNHAVFKTYWSESYFSSNVDDKKMERIMAIYDYILSEEGQKLLTYGFEGEDYTVDGDTITQITTDLATKYPSRGQFNMQVAYNSDATYDMNNGTIVNKKLRQAAVDYIDWICTNTKVPKFYPELTYVSTKTKDTFTIMEHDDLLNIMMGSDSVEDMWEATIATYKAKGLDKMIEEVNAKASEMGLN